MNRAQGFTLVEVLVAITITSLLLMTIYGVFSGTSEAKQRVEQRNEAVHLGRVLFARISREILGLALSETGDTPILAGGRTARNEPYLEMSTSVDEGRDQGLRSIRYRLAFGEEDEKLLWRKSTPLLLSDEPWPEQRLARDISEMELRFYDGGRWRDEWDSRQHGRPKLVELTLHIRNGDETLPLHTIFRPPQREQQ